SLFNAVICAVIVLALMLYQRQRHGARNRPLISVLAYVLVLIYAVIPFRFVFGLYHDSNWLAVTGNALTCAVVLWYRGNVARIIAALRH
ncbi:hypothetical protein GTGU_04790, partial [Trabulsiella guamensis ATCC 49490]